MRRVLCVIVVVLVVIGCNKKAGGVTAEQSATVAAGTATTEDGDGVPRPGDLILLCSSCTYEASGHYGHGHVIMMDVRTRAIWISDGKNDNWTFRRAAAATFDTAQPFQ